MHAFFISLWGLLLLLSSLKGNSGKNRVLWERALETGLGTWEESAVIYENASTQVVLWIADRDTLKLDLFVVIRRRQIPLALIWLNEAAYTVVLSACIWY